MRKALLGVIVGLSVAEAVVAQPPKERDWAATLRTDAQAMHDDISANHPGTVNALDPGFAKNNDRQLAIALDRAKTARTYADYFFPLRQYVASFNDGHMGFGAFGETPNDIRWPGFATHYDGTGAIVVGTDEPGSPVPKGARLIGCDGMTADQYTAATLGKMWGRWNLESQQQGRGWHLFIDESSNIISIAKKCTFMIGKARKTVVLQWRALPVERVGTLLDSLSGGQSREFGARALRDGSRWFVMPSFSGDPGSDAVKALPGMIKSIADQRSSLASAPAIVLDVRGNGGGTSDWSRQIAVALWGEAAIAALPDGPEVHVDWRASPVNLAAIATAYAERRGNDGFSTETDGWYRSVIAGLGVAIARQQPLWRHVEFDDRAIDPKAAAAPTPRAVVSLPKLAAPVYVLTDSSCGSACLDALDLWTALGAIQIGRATNADTLYMEIRQRKLPSGITSFSAPMKVFRGRARGSNVPAIPTHRFAGDIGDTSALEQWVATLPERRRR